MTIPNVLAMEEAKEDVHRGAEAGEIKDHVVGRLTKIKILALALKDLDEVIL